jgi:hypothetical protein
MVRFVLEKTVLAWAPLSSTDKTLAIVRKAHQKPRVFRIKWTSCVSPQSDPNGVSAQPESWIERRPGLGPQAGLQAITTNRQAQS